MEDTDLKHFGALPFEENGKKHIVKIVPSFDFLIIEIDGDIKKIDLGDSERLEQELLKGKTIEMDLVIGSEEAIRVKIIWSGQSLAGGSKATTIKIAEEMKIAVKKAKPTATVEKEIKETIRKIESNLFPFIVTQDIDVFRGALSINKVVNWYA